MTASRYLRTATLSFAENQTSSFSAFSFGSLLLARRRPDVAAKRCLLSGVGDNGLYVRDRGAKRSRPPSAPLLSFEIDPRNVRYVLECGSKAECDRRAARGGVIETQRFTGQSGGSHIGTAFCPAANARTWCHDGNDVPSHGQSALQRQARFSAAPSRKNAPFCSIDLVRLVPCP